MELYNMPPAMFKILHMIAYEKMEAAEEQAQQENKDTLNDAQADAIEDALDM